ncbi:MAG: hypothetical protein OXE95_07100 [Chloroflexi bacterium]|nr:hypothetical protein [Chloroflexota bacterium]MCY4247322.1 hypothetical protein [Chloroflexota bacterium]
MKSTENVRNRSRFWSRLLGVLIAFAIATLLVFGGVQGLMSELADAHDALTASRAETAYIKAHLDNAKAVLAQSQSDLARSVQANDSQARQLRLAGQALAAANAEIDALSAERNDLKRGLREAAQTLAQTDRSYKAATADSRQARAELERIKQQPKISMVMTTEREFTMSQREQFAASQTRLFAESDAGVIYYDASKAFRQKEQHLTYKERSQVVLTQTGPGDDVLRCLRDGCAMILAAQQNALRMDSYVYQSQFVSSERLMIAGRPR